MEERGTDEAVWFEATDRKLVKQGKDSDQLPSTGQVALSKQQQRRNCDL